MKNVSEITAAISDVVDIAFINGDLPEIKEVILPQEYDQPGNFFEVVSNDGTLWRITPQAEAAPSETAPRPEHP